MEIKNNSDGRYDIENIRRIRKWVLILAGVTVWEYQHNPFARVLTDRLISTIHDAREIINHNEKERTEGINNSITS